ncbi:hypothetical protein OO17_17550 [Rhodopseudomonas palustris]|uniref:Uncharacterized protein n=1 Tax=Rhodopseudomonas palustris TaxID=1076 RepID=A0A0D7EIN6_RHOPL|nr:hypothetical protein OO17_17550 [Rhodopseudomonas palustris]
MAKEIKNIGASVRARLLQISKTSGQTFDLILTRFALERLLFRLLREPDRQREDRKNGTFEVPLRAIMAIIAPNLEVCNATDVCT